MTEYTLFYKSAHPFSNWYASNFIHDGIHYNCSEQFMMREKALLFEDHEVAQLIMEQTDPRKQKFLGRQVRDFNQRVWLEKCEDIMVPALVSKFTQNNYLKKFILDTGYSILVEASPTDKIWGIGLAEDDPRALNRVEWQGTNLLGNVLMRAREIIRNAE